MNEPILIPIPENPEDAIFWEPDDPISHYLWDKGETSEGLSVIPYADIWVVLESPGSHRRHKYLGWFLVSENFMKQTENFFYIGQFEKYHLWRLKSDLLPE